jgi:hypothetical protein
MYLRPLSKRDVVIGTAICIGIGSVAALVYHPGFYTPPIAERGHVTAVGTSDPAKRVTATTRSFILRRVSGARRFWQVEFPDGVWTDCHPDRRDITESGIQRIAMYQDCSQHTPHAVLIRTA